MAEPTAVADLRETGKFPGPATAHECGGPVISGMATKSHWLPHWPEIEARIASRPRVLLAFGFDGILAPTAPRPADALLPGTTRALLETLGGSHRVSLAFLSGRSLGDIQARVAMPNVFYAGNHGMEVRGPGLSMSDGLAVNCRSDLVDALAFLTRCSRKLRGVFIEDKGMTVNVHWRFATPEEREALRQAMEVIVRHHPRLRVFPGEACWELRARASWHKGDALRQIMTHLGLSSADAVYLGEAHTDEDAFRKLTAGLSFCAGNSEATSAHYHLADTADAARLLLQLCGALLAPPAPWAGTGAEKNEPFPDRSCQVL